MSLRRLTVPWMSCRPLTVDEGAVLEALAVGPATVDHLAEQLRWETARVRSTVDRLRADGFVFGVDHLALSGSGQYHGPSQRDRRIDPS